MPNLRTASGSGSPVISSRRTRARLIERLQAEGVSDSRVLAVMSEVPRHLFVDEALASRAYEDTALPIGKGQTISQPYIVARMTEVLLEHGPLENVLEVGTGSGYQTAVLGSIPSRTQKIFSVERLAPLVARARDAGVGERITTDRRHVSQNNNRDD